MLFINNFLRLPKKVKCHPFIACKNHVQAGSKVYFIYLESILNSVSTSKARALESEPSGGDTSPVSPACQGCSERLSMWGLPGSREQQRVPRPEGSLPQAQKGGTGAQTQAPEGPVLCHCAQEQQKPTPTHCLFSSLPSPSSHANQAGNFHNNKAGMEFLFWKIFNISSSFGSYRMKLFFLQEEEEIIS